MGCTSSKELRTQGHEPLGNGDRNKAKSDDRPVQPSIETKGAANVAKGDTNGVSAAVSAEPEGTQAKETNNGANPEGDAAPAAADSDSKDRPYGTYGQSYDVGNGEYTYTGAPIPSYEAQRIAKLKNLKILDTEEEERFNHITKTLATLFQTPIALVSLVDEDRQWFKSKVGLDACSTDRNSSFCAWTLLPRAPEVLVVEDTLNDERFKSNPLVIGAPFIRFYAGAPVVTTDGTRLGSLCIIDDKPRKFTQEQCKVLANFSEIVSREIERDSLVQRKVAQSKIPSPDDSSAEIDRLRRALDALSEALILVDAGRPGFPVVYSNVEWRDLAGMTGEDGAPDGRSLWDFVVPVKTAGRAEAPKESDFAEAVRARQVFSLSAQLGKAGALVSCRFKPAEQAMDVNVEEVQAAAIKGSELNPGGLTGYAPAGSSEGGEEEEEVDDLKPVGDGDWETKRALYFVTVVRDRPINSSAAPETQGSGPAMTSSAGQGPMTSGMGTASGAGHSLKAPVAPFVDVRVGRLIGKGGYGAVYRGLWDGAPVAVKIMRHAPPEDATEYEVQCQFEAVVSVNIAHPNLVQSFKFSSRPCMDDSKFWETWVVQEYCDMGNLQEACDKRKFMLDGAPNYPIIVSVLREVAGAILHLHSRGIVHGDLSANNVMLSSRERSRKGYMAKVGDFGLAKTIGDIKSAITLSKFGTPTHMPPELLRDGTFSAKCDVYSFGVLIWQMWTCERPWHGMSPQQVAAAVGINGQRLSDPENMPDELRALFDGCLATDPDARPTFEDILAAVMGMEKKLKKDAKAKGMSAEDKANEAFLAGE